MIKNVVFDFGQVLVRFSPAEMVRKRVSDEADAAVLEAVVFDRLYWDKLDEGTIENEEVVKAFQSRLPNRLWAIAEEIFYDWVHGLPPIEGMAELVYYVKEALKKLSERERKIMFLRFGLGGGEEMTQKDVADMMGISQSYISRLEKKIILRLKKEIAKME